MARSGDHRKIREVVGTAALCLRENRPIPELVSVFLADTLQLVANGEDPARAFNLDHPPHRTKADGSPSLRHEAIGLMQVILATGDLLSSIHGVPRLSKTKAAQIVIERYRLPFGTRTVLNWYRQPLPDVGK